MTYYIAVIVGSLRKESFNRKLAAGLEKLAMQGRKQPAFDAPRVSHPISVVCPNVKCLLGQITSFGLAAAETETKSVKVAIVTIHHVFKLRIGGHCIVIPKWECPIRCLFPRSGVKCCPVERDWILQFLPGGNNLSGGASYPKRKHEFKPNLFARSHIICRYSTGGAVAFSKHISKSQPVA